MKTLTEIRNDLEANGNFFNMLSAKVFNRHASIDEMIQWVKDNPAEFEAYSGVKVGKIKTNNTQWERTRIDDILYHSETDRYAFFNPIENEIETVGFLDECKLASALFLFNSEKRDSGSLFDADSCLEDIHRIYGMATCKAVKENLNQ